MYEKRKDRNYFSIMEIESIVKVLTSIEIDEDTLRRVKYNADRLKLLVDRCVKNIDSRGTDNGQPS